MSFVFKMLSRFLSFVSALYLLGLAIYLAFAIRLGSVRIVSDFWMPYELILVLGLIGFQVWKIIRP